MAFNVTVDSTDFNGCYAQKNFSIQTDLWYEVKVTFAAQTLTSTVTDGSNNTFLIAPDQGGSWTEGVEIDSDGGTGVLLQTMQNVTSFVPVASTQYLVELHLTSNGASPYDVDFYVDGSLEVSGTGPPHTGWTGVLVGFPFGTDNDIHCTLEDLRVGTTRHGTEIFADDFSAGSFAGYDDVSTDANNTFTFGGSAPVAGIEGISIAFDDPTLEPDPTWTRIDSDIRVASFSIDRGRSFELDRTDTGRATVIINDTDGSLDPTNTTGPYFGKLEPLLQIALALHNPVTDTWSTLFRGYIEDIAYEASPSQRVNRLSIACVDAFEILQAVEMIPDGTFGDPPDKASAGDIVYDIANVDDRIIQALADAGWPSALSTIFSGNVAVQQTVYSTGQSILEVCQDAADAEHPAVANLYVSRLGKVTFHGRKAKFDPEGVSHDAGADAWPFTNWKCGDGTAVAGSPTDTAHIRGITGSRGLEKIRNSAIATPKMDPGETRVNLDAQIVTDPTSIGIFGVRSWSAMDLITLEGLNDSLNKYEETQLYAQFVVDNYKVARDRISSLIFKSIQPDATGAAANWALLCGAEIADAIDVTITYPGGGGFNLEPCFIEGIHYEVTRANPDYHMVTLTLDVSPRAYFDVSPFTGDT